MEDQPKKDQNEETISRKAETDRPSLSDHDPDWPPLNDRPDPAHTTCGCAWFDELGACGYPTLKGFGEVSSEYCQYCSAWKAKKADEKTKFDEDALAKLGFKPFSNHGIAFYKDISEKSAIYVSDDSLAFAFAEHGYQGAKQLFAKQIRIPKAAERELRKVGGIRIDETMMVSVDE